MATVVIQDPPVGVTLEMHDAVDALLGITKSPPDGMILHTAGMDGNRMRVVDLWESAEDYRRFADERLMPAIEQVSRDAGMPPPADRPRATIFEAERYLAGSGVLIAR
jgi:hypothetical protein